ncbi:EthD family reductase [Moritella sp.]|uniref:EthD family reductase n=1 Tax=Moritella sp. TaxID=78556 RepID=UPI001D210A57|nr:EthD family reductase [Moritella sp.]MCJ8350856.1 EthD family reductase [Moritella sp.]NQZ40456.1 EthD family reductase [Moritella sp.]
MINIASIYEKMDDYHFDFDYYLNIHMPMSIEILSNAEGFKGVKVERGIDISNTIDSTYVAMCHYYFDTLENFMAAFIPHAEKLQDDVRNYTNIEPTIQINEVELTL